MDLLHHGGAAHGLPFWQPLGDGAWASPGLCSQLCVCSALLSAGLNGQLAVEYSHVGIRTNLGDAIRVLYSKDLVKRG